MSSAGPSGWKDAKRWLPGVGISAVVIFLLFRAVNGQELLAAFRQVNPLHIVLAGGLTLAFLWLRGVAARVLLQGQAGVMQAFWAINEGYLINNLLPLRAGELARAIFLGKSSGLGTFHVLSTIIIERAFDIAIAAGLLLSTLPLALGVEWAKPVAYTMLGLVAAGLLALYLAARNRDKVLAGLARWGGRWNFTRRYVVPQLDALLNGLQALTQPRRFALALFLVLGTWFTSIVQYYVVTLSFVPNAPLWWGAFLVAMLGLGIAVPAAPGALGVFEAALVGALVLLGIPASQALAYAVIMHALQYAITGVLGGIGLMNEKLSISALMAQLRPGNPPGQP